MISLLLMECGGWLVLEVIDSDYDSKSVFVLFQHLTSPSHLGIRII